MFYKTRMRRLLRRMIMAAQPDGLRPGAAAVAASALMYERAAVAFGLTWRGLSPAQGALVVVLGARVVARLGAAEAALFESAAHRFAQSRGLEAFAAGIARDIARIEQVVVSGRRGRMAGPLGGPADFPVMA
mgnify:CR=1 FL=1